MESWFESRFKRNQAHLLSKLKPAVNHTANFVLSVELMALNLI